MKHLCYFCDSNDDELSVESNLEVMYSEIFTFALLFRYASANGFPDFLVSHMHNILDHLENCISDLVFSFHFLSFDDPQFESVLSLCSSGRRMRPAGTTAGASNIDN